MEEFIETLQLGLYQTFVYQDNYTFFLSGLRITLMVWSLAFVLGLILGVILSLIHI